MRRIFGILPRMVYRLFKLTLIHEAQKGGPLACLRAAVPFGPWRFAATLIECLAFPTAFYHEDATADPIGTFNRSSWGHSLNTQTA
jgi:hypothetical protein